MAVERSVRAQPRPATIYDVAAAADVSPTTVTRVLRGYAGIREATRVRVERALEELAYRPNLTAKSLATMRESRIGAIVQSVQEVGPARILNGASRSAREAGFALDIVQLDGYSAEEIDDAIRQLSQHALAGIIAFVQTDEVAAAFARANLNVPARIAGVDHEASPSNGDTGESLLVEHLVGLGHRRFVHVSGPRHWHSAQQREAAYHSALSAIGLTSLGTYLGDWSSESGYSAGLLLPPDGSVTAVVAANDQTAFGVIRALTDRGVRVPEDISVVGFDDVAEARYFRPSITTVAIDFDLIGRLEVERLLTSIQGVDPESSGSVLPRPLLQVRESSGPPRS